MKVKKIREARGGIRIRKFRMADYDYLMALWENAGLPHKPKGRDSKKSISRELGQTNAVFLVAEKDGFLIGSAFGTHDGRKGWINRVAVLPVYRRKGVAADLVREVEKRIRRMGIHITACLVEGWNRDSLEFFEKMGYVCHRDIFYLTKREGDYI